MSTETGAGRPTPVIEFLASNGDWYPSKKFHWESGHTIEDAKQGDLADDYRYRPGTEPELQINDGFENWAKSEYDGERTLEVAQEASPWFEYRYAPNPFAAKSEPESPKSTVADKLTCTVTLDASDLIKQLYGAVLLTKEEAALLYTAVRYQTMSKHFEGIVAKLAAAAGN